MVYYLNHLLLLLLAKELGTGSPLDVCNGLGEIPRMTINELYSSQTSDYITLLRMKDGSS